MSSSQMVKENEFASDKNFEASRAFCLFSDLH